VIRLAVAATRIIRANIHARAMCANDRQQTLLATAGLTAPRPDRAHVCDYTGQGGRAEASLNAHVDADG